MTTTTAAADALVSATHPFAGHLHRAAAAERHPSWTPDDGALPAMYLSHGAPPLLADAGWMAELHTWAHDLPRPRAVLVVSAHWESDAIAITNPHPRELVYDFWGFDPIYEQMRYDVPDASWLSRRAREVMPDGVHVHEQTARGLDHGAWVPLKAMYPEADVPVLQLSLPTADPERLLRLGAALRPLRDEGVLVLGSGFMTHGLPFIQWSQPDVVPTWSSEFDAWAAEALGRGDVEELARFAERAPGVGFAHPTVEHFTPLFVTLGAAADPAAPVQAVVEGYWTGLSKRSFQVA